jgi:hypothetical protein
LSSSNYSVLPTPSCITLLDHSLVILKRLQSNTWFLEDANLFFSHKETLFGLHHAKFQTAYFSGILNIIGSGQTIARVTIPTFPISFDDISQTTLIAFIYLVYYPESFFTTRDGWQAIKKLALKWCFTRIMIRALHELQHFDQHRFSPFQ